jgi:hypothetical protein
LRIHRIRSQRPLQSADGGFAIDRQAPGFTELPNNAVTNDTMGSAIIDLHEQRRGALQSHEPWFHLMWFSAVFPVLFGDHSPGETWLVTYATGWPGRWSDQTATAEASGWEVELTDGAIHIRRDGKALFTSPDFP